MANPDLIAYAQASRAQIEREVSEHGGLLFRGFRVNAEKGFEEFIKTVSGATLSYRERSSPRTAVVGNIYTSTDYPPTEAIFLHNENSYQQTVPLRIFFYCALPAETGGETPIADCRRVYQRIDPRVRSTLLEKKWMYVRNFGDGFGLPWQTVFGTSDRSVVDRYCAERDIQAEWKSGNRLRIRSVLEAAVRHPRTGEMTWFNHAAFFHITTLDSRLREALLAEFEENDLPTNTFYGDGSPIPTEVLDHLREAYAAETVVFDWREGDVLMLDNLLVAHGRNPYVGARKVRVGMAEPLTRSQFCQM